MKVRDIFLLLSLVVWMSLPFDWNVMPQPSATSADWHLYTQFFSLETPILANIMARWSDVFYDIKQTFITPIQSAPSRVIWQGQYLA